MGLTMKERNSVTKETAKRYRTAGRKEKGRILDEFVQLTGFARKYAVSKLNGCIQRREHEFNNVTIRTVKVEPPKRKKRIYIPKYGKDTAASLNKIWRTFDFMCGQRLVPFIRENLDELAAEPCFEITRNVYEDLKKNQQRHGKPSAEARPPLSYRLHGTCTTKAAGNLNKLIPVRAFFDWDERRPGFFEMDTVAHDGGNASGEYCFTLNFTDVCTGWTVLYSLLNKAQRWIKEDAADLKKSLPYNLLGLDSDNGSEFKNYQLLSWCNENNVTFTRSRSYRKNDNCFVEQKNYSAVRHLAGYYRYEGEAARIALQNLYNRWNLLVNYFYPSVKILEKERKDAHTYKKYDSVKTPYKRCLESDFISDEAKSRLRINKSKLNAVQLKKEVEECLDIVLQHAKKWK